MILQGIFNIRSRKPGHEEKRHKMILGHQGRGGNVCWFNSRNQVAVAVAVDGVGARQPKAATATSAGIVSCESMYK